MYFRSANISDLTAIKKLLASAALPIADCKDHLEEFTVACQHEALIATICLERSGQYALLRSLAVDQPFLNQKIGTQLVKYVIEQARAATLDAVYLLTEQAETYFTQFGFLSIERLHAPPAIQQTQQFTNLCPESAILMKLDLS